jgi:threonine synthase
MIDTHTADGVKVAREYLQAGIPMLVLETALPIKFEETILEALGRPAECPAAFKDIKSKSQRVENIDVDVNQVKAFITTHLN